MLQIKTVGAGFVVKLQYSAFPFIYTLNVRYIGYCMLAVENIKFMKKSFTSFRMEVAC